MDNHIEKVDWKVPIKDWDLVDADTYKLILSEAEKMLKDVSEDSEKTSNRIYGIIAILIIVYGGIITTLVKCLPNSEYRLLSGAFLIVGILLTAVFYKLYSLVKSRIIYRIGTEPKELLTCEYFEVEGDAEKDRLNRVYLHVIEQYQEKIILNEDLNKVRIEEFNDCIQWICYSLFGLLVAVGMFFFKVIF